MSAPAKLVNANCNCSGLIFIVHLADAEHFIF